ncbi:MAG: hypothetical protein ACJ72Z_14000 [Pyrinomonadaceae bacterium]
MKPKLINHIAAILLTLGLVAWFQETFSIEWSFPYCSDQVDGPASAVWGMPFPYIRWSTVSSMEYFWMPAAFILNLAVLSAIAFPFVSWVLRAGRLPSFVRTGAWLVGLLLVVSFGAWTVMLIQTGVYRIPVTNIANEGYESYTDFRPVHFGFKTLRYDCTPLK